MALAVIAKDTRFREGVTEAHTLAVQRRMETTFVRRHGMEDLVFVHPGYRRPNRRLHTLRLILKELDRDFGSGRGAWAHAITARCAADFDLMVIAVVMR